MREKTKKKTKPKQQKSIYTCSHCHKTFDNSSNWHSHVKLHSTEEPYHCEICDYKCKVKKYLTSHIKKAHTKPTNHQCPTCGKCFHFHCKLRDHMRVHTGEKPFKCDECDKAFSSSYSLNGHKLIHTGEKPFQCQYCDYACRDNSTIRRHMERHLGLTKNYLCSICKKNFKKKETLQLHVDEVHFELNTRKHPCEQCDKVFKTKGTLRMHIKTVHKKVNRIKCEICGVGTTKNNLQAHMRRHIDVRPYKCSYKPCGKRFKDKGDVKRHSRIHFPDNQHVCSLCSRRFARKFRLNKHMLNGCRRVQCHHCGQLFSAKKFLAQHLKNAHGPYPKAREYLCDVCDMVTYSRRGIIQHLKYGHGTEKDTKCEICKKDYFKYLTLKEHYLSHHNLKYTLLEKKKEDEILVKEEPFEELEEIDDPPEFMYEVNIQKQDVDDSTPSTPLPSLQPPSPEHFNIDSDTITYSKRVLSEDISRSLIERDTVPEDEFDEFFIGHVLKKPEEVLGDTPKQITDEKKKERVAKRLEKLLNEVRIRNQYVVLDKLRKQYNRRIKMATSSGNKKEQKSIRYFKKSENNNESAKPQKDNNNDEEIHGNDDDEINNQETEDKEQKRDSEKENDEMIVKDDNKINDEDIAEKSDDDDSNDETINDEKDDDSDFKISDEESNPNRTLKFNTHQCYICFKLFKTKTDLKRHCTQHFDICNEKMLKKCPFCGYVTNKQISKHIKLKHKVSIDLPYGKIKERDTQNGSKYVFEIDKNCDLEIIPSISNLNKIASMKIDEKNRASKNIFLGTTKLVKQGGDWIVAKQAVDLSNEYILPEFSEEEYQKLKTVGDNYLERIRSLSILAKKKGLKILYPCDGCDKICLTMSALKLHSRKHELNPKRFKPKVWKNKILNGLGGRYSHVNKKTKKKNGNNQSGVSNKKSKKIRGKLEVVTKKDTNEAERLANRFADPSPVKNKHKCDKELIRFYKENIKGGDIEFWHFLKIFNKMSRENVNDFKDLENRHDFGMHNIVNEVVNENTTEVNNEDTVDNTRVITKKSRIRRKKKAFTRAIMISKKEYLRRNEIKNQMRERLKAQNNTF